MSWKWNSSHSTDPHQSIWNSPPNFLQQKNCNSLLQKEVVLLTITLKNCMGKKSPNLHLTLLYLYKKEKLLDWPKMNFGLPQRFNPTFCLVVSAHKLYNILHLKQNLIEHFYEEGPAWSLMNFFHAWASAAMPSKFHGSRKQMFSSYLVAWFLTTSILVGLRRSWSSSKWMLTIAWATAFFRIYSSRSMTSWISCSSSWNLFCSFSMNHSCSGIASSLFSTET